MILLGLAATSPQTYEGARAVLRRMGTPPAGSVFANPLLKLESDAAAFGDRLANQSSVRAAESWISLVDRCFAIAPPEGGNLYNNDLGQLLQVVAQTLPSPAAWRRVRALLASRKGDPPARTEALLLLMDVLQARYAAALERVRRLRRFAWGSFGQRDLNNVEIAIAVRSRDRRAVEDVLSKEANELERVPEPKRRSDPQISIPDLVPVFGEKWTAQLLERLLFGAKVELAFSRDQGNDGEGDRRTEALARKIALANVSRLAWPQWALACSPESGDLYLRLKQKFPKWQSIRMMDQFDVLPCDVAPAYCLVNLFSAGRIGEARSFAVTYAGQVGYPFQLSAPEEYMLRGLRPRAKLDAFLEFLGDAAVKNGGWSLPKAFLSFATDREDPARYEKALRRILESNTEDFVKSQAHDELQKLLLRSGRLKEAVASLPDPATLGTYLYAKSAQLLLTLGSLLDLPDLRQRSFRVVEQTGQSRYAREMDRAGRGPVVEAKLIDRLRVATVDKGTFPRQDQAALIELARFYFALGRYADVASLIDHATEWEATDVADPSSDYELATSDLVMLAKSLTEVGRRADALCVAQFAVRSRPPDDAAYGLLLDLDQASAARTFQELSLESPNSARPPTWLAAALLRAGRLSDAEALARHAIRLDPDDVEAWGKPTRFKAYMVLSDVLRRRGKAVPAMRLAVRAEAAALAVRASDLETLDLYQQSEDLWRRALTLVPDDFRARIELGLMELRTHRLAEGSGDIATAFRGVPDKLPPDSVDGFRGIIMDEAARPYLKPVLEKKAAEGSHNAVVYALLGEIHRLEDDNVPNAVRYYQLAVALDPNCLIAWNGLAMNMRFLPSDLAERTTAMLPRLPPHRGYRPGPDILDYRAGWRGAERAARNCPPRPRSVLEFPATRAWLAKSADVTYIQGRCGRPWEPGLGPPAERIAADPLVTAIINLLPRLPQSESAPYR